MRSTGAISTGIRVGETPADVLGGGWPRCPSGGVLTVGSLVGKPGSPAVRLPSGLRQTSTRSTSLAVGKVLIAYSEIS